LKALEAKHLGKKLNFAQNSTFSSKFGEKVKVKHAPARPGDVKHTQADVSYATKDFGYKPLVRFWEGLDRTIEWWGLNSFEDNK